MQIDQYDREQFEKVMTVVNAAGQNTTMQTDIEISTSGSNPSARVRIPAYVLKKFLTPPKSK